MSIRVAGRTDSGTSFALTAATRDGSALEQSKHGIDSNAGYVPIRDQFQYGMRSNAGSVPMRGRFQCSPACEVGGGSVGKG